MLLDKKADFAIAQMPAIVLYLGETTNLIPAGPALRAMTMMIVDDANDPAGIAILHLPVVIVFRLLHLIAGSKG
jgi:glutathione S-transferase